MVVPKELPRLIIRADASTKIGTGHLMRCLALAQAWQDNQGQAVFFMASSVPAIEKRLQSEGMKVIHTSVIQGSSEDAVETVNIAHNLNAEWVVVDGYHFGSEYQKLIKESGLHLLFIDDYGHANHYYADLVLNQNIHAHENLYFNKESYTQLLLGTDYTLLRREFWQWRGWKRETPSVANKILVTLGGADPDNVTSKVIQGLQLVEGEELEVVVVVGGSNPHYEQLKTATKQSSFPIRLERNVTNMPELMAWADVAIASAGSTSWELAFMGLPSLVLILADNQRDIAQKLGEIEVSINLGWHEDVSVEQISKVIIELLESAEIRSKMTSLGNELVSGEGSNKVLVSLQGKEIRLRPVNQTDCKLLWHWANDPEVRSVSFSSNSTIPWNNHVQWFNSKLSSPNCIIYIAINKLDEPIGQVRFDIKANEATISISIDANFRSQSYGSKLIKIATEKLFFESDIKTINAYIKNDNYKSVKSFINSGFHQIKVVDSQEYKIIHLGLNKHKSKLKG
ncbi:MAG: UDP-2,4-diacetamido-2,4,6-trideoxy-beta-L-altropyranose hydrolase [Rivularia sp. (in: Bacteria)]|nr:UDP-2,4-diacetamido-2,4,6-trideoxy-beta-L-altropyranose hydrolase [Rivularia sp. MS3]